MALLDGNALAGPLVELLGWDATASIIRCTHCGARGALASVVVYASPMGSVARCAGCDAVLLTLVDAPDGRGWVGMPGLDALEVRRDR
ncbi:DUF6510 family protein [Microbacterium testaceum]|uniref:DUF6510 family protein n=1 Tax=Microbacterium testaceum TaxID=2033 RepID=UPI001247050C|nr:DUF6510 family protein [Microbacterium testaceum]